MKVSQVTSKFSLSVPWADLVYRADNVLTSYYMIHVTQLPEEEVPTAKTTFWSFFVFSIFVTDCEEKPISPMPIRLIMESLGFSITVLNTTRNASEVPGHFPKILTKRI